MDGVRRDGLHQTRAQRRSSLVLHAFLNSLFIACWKSWHRALPAAPASGCYQLAGGSTTRRAGRAPLQSLRLGHYPLGPASPIPRSRPTKPPPGTSVAGWNELGRFAPCFLPQLARSPALRSAFVLLRRHRGLAGFGLADGRQRRNDALTAEAAFAALSVDEPTRTRPLRGPPTERLAWRRSAALGRPRRDAQRGESCRRRATAQWICRRSRNGSSASRDPPGLTVTPHVGEHGPSLQPRIVDSPAPHRARVAEIRVIIEAEASIDRWQDGGSTISAFGRLVELFAVHGRR